RVLDPWSTPLAEILAAATFPRDLELTELEFRRTDAGYRVTGDGVAGTAVPGQPFEAKGALLTLRPGELPREFTLELSSHQSAVQRTLKALGVDRAGGSVAELSYRDLDPATAAAVPNAVIEK